MMGKEGFSGSKVYWESLKYAVRVSFLMYSLAFWECDVYNSLLLVRKISAVFWIRYSV